MKSVRIKVTPAVSTLRKIKKGTFAFSFETKEPANDQITARIFQLLAARRSPGYRSQILTPTQRLASRCRTWTLVSRGSLSGKPGSPHSAASREGHWLISLQPRVVRNPDGKPSLSQEISAHTGQAEQVTPPPRPAARPPCMWA